MMDYEASSDDIVRWLSANASEMLRLARAEIAAGKMFAALQKLEPEEGDDG